MYVFRKIIARTSQLTKGIIERQKMVKKFKFLNILKRPAANSNNGYSLNGLVRFAILSHNMIIVVIG